VSSVGHSVGAAVMGSRRLEDWESAPLMTIGGVCAAIAAIALWRPAVLAWPIALALAWIGLSFMAEAAGLIRRRRHP
jgi:hypothetical protein